MNFLLGLRLDAYVCIGADGSGKKVVQVVDIRYPGPVGNPKGGLVEDILEKTMMATEEDGALIQSPPNFFSNTFSP